MSLAELDFYGCVKLINYVRRSVRDNGPSVDVSSRALFESDEYLKPTLEDDAVLFGIDEILESIHANDPPPAEMGREESQDTKSVRIKQLEEQLEQMQTQFTAYREDVARTLDRRWNEREPLRNAPPAASVSSAQDTAEAQDDKDYFDSYSFSDIHETMLRDSVRTSSYRDFVYSRKDLFKDAVVLDVGCGTGILSLFAAKAGAREVLAVEASEISIKAHEIVLANDLGAVVKVVRGQIEDPDPPNALKALKGSSDASSASPNDEPQPSNGSKEKQMPQTGRVNVLISEWMGYALLYEAMLPTILHARDTYLSPDPSSLIVPSHTSLVIAPIAGSAFLDDKASFWSDVYGFDFGALDGPLYTDMLIQSLPVSSVASKDGRGAPFKVFDLYTVQSPELQFEDARFEVELGRDVDALDGWLIWFDTFFLPGGRLQRLPAGARAEEWTSSDNNSVAFTTGPKGEQTHWQAGVCVIDRRKKKPAVGADGKPSTWLPAGARIKGNVAYRAGKLSKRALEVEVSWEVEGAKEEGRQVWCLR